jgi:hypothetical protein
MKLIICTYDDPI